MCSRFTTTIVVSTYNGSRYVEEQLDSIRFQTRKPDKVLICDDCSTDETPNIVRSYIDEWRLGSSGWDLQINKRNLGWKANFRRLILGAETDLIFPCDQDDIWDRHKVERMASVMEEREDIALLASLVDPFYESGSHATAAETTSAYADGTVLVVQPALSCMAVRRPGCSYCVRSSFAREISPWWDDTYAHDAMLWRYAAFTGRLGLLEASLVRFRRHDSNASSRKKATRRTRLSEIDYFESFVASLNDYLKTTNHHGDAEVSFEGYCEWLSARRSLLSRDRPLSSLPILIKHLDCYQTVRSFVVDVFCALGFSM